MTIPWPENRDGVIDLVAAKIRALPATAARLVAIDGVDGAGKTHFADEVAAALRRAGEPVIRASVDGFHHPAEIRYRRGRSSAAGFYRDSYDYPRLRRLLLDPLRPGGSGRYVRAVYDVHAEAPVQPLVEVGGPGAVLVFDGIFLHRDELQAYWDFSVFLRVPFAVSIPRGAQRGYGDADPAGAGNARYVGGQLLYLGRDPEARATVVIDNTVLDRPMVLADRS